MTWFGSLHGLSAHLPKISARFPHAQDHIVHSMRDDWEALLTYLADRHDITRQEALEEMADWLFIERLNNEL